MGKILINGLRLTAYHGVMEQERKVGNEFLVSVCIDVPSADNAMVSDDLVHTISYAEIVEIIKKEMSVPSRLIEHVAGRIRRSICLRYGDLIAAGKVSVSKLAPPISAQLESVSFVTEW